MRVHAAVATLLLALAASAAAQEPVVTIRGPVRGRAAGILAAALAGPHHTVVRPTERVDLPRDSVITSTIIILGSRTTVASAVEGDVIVVNGDLFLHPGAKISGRVISIGGGVYGSLLAQVKGESEKFPDAVWTIDSTPAGYELEDTGARAAVPDLISFPVVKGFRIPAYDRLNGLSIPFGPTLTYRRLTIDPIVTYRSNLGEVDASAEAVVRVARHVMLEADGGRATRSNDRWIQSEISNSLSSLLSGHDFRNYYRADYAVGRLSHIWQTNGADIALWGGARSERAWSIERVGAWSFRSRTDTVEGMRRPNPAIDDGHISSGLAGGSLDWEVDDVHVKVRAEVELPWDAPRDARFQQTTAHAEIGFKTFGEQRLDFRSHVVMTTGDTASRQRFVYLGGQGTIPTLDVLSRGGDRLVFFETDYSIPVPRIQLPLVGAPTFTLRHLIGAAGVQRLGTFDQNLGLRLALSFFRAEIFLDPSNRHTEGGVGLSLTR
ncbi:MAG: hypothetical protein ABJD07_12290 [Gemmatimonadaceae bacterium]